MDEIKDRMEARIASLEANQGQQANQGLQANNGQQANNGLQANNGPTTGLEKKLVDFVAQHSPFQPTRIDSRLVQAFRTAVNAQRPKYKMTAYMVVKKAKSAGLVIADDCRCYLP